MFFNATFNTPQLRTQCTVTKTYRKRKLSRFYVHLHEYIYIYNFFFFISARTSTTNNLNNTWENSLDESEPKQFGFYPMCSGKRKLGKAIMPKSFRLSDTRVGVRWSIRYYSKNIWSDDRRNLIKSNIEIETQFSKNELLFSGIKENVF